MVKQWKCPKCSREFGHRNQSHSCVIYPLEKHFINKEYAFELFTYLKEQIEKSAGPLKIESLPCCIHLVSKHAFGAVWARKDGLKIDFRLDSKLDSKRFLKIFPISSNRTMYYLGIEKKDEIDKELLDWIKEAYELSMKE